MTKFDAFGSTTLLAEKRNGLAGRTPGRPHRISSSPSTAKNPIVHRFTFAYMQCIWGEEEKYVQPGGPVF